MDLGTPGQQIRFCPGGFQRALPGGLKWEVGVTFCLFVYLFIYLFIYRKISPELTTAQGDGRGLGREPGGQHAAVTGLGRRT